MTSRKILNLLRSLFLGLSLACAATAAVWHYYPDLVQRVDESFVASHVESATSGLSEAQYLQRKGERDEALAAYEGLARRLRDSKPGDRRFRTRKKAIEGAAQLLIEGGETQPALEWCDELHEIDPRDMVNNLRRVRLLRLSGRADDGRTLLAEITRVAKGDRRIQAELVTTLLDYGEAEIALHVMLGHPQQGLAALGGDRWQVFLPSAETTWTAQPTMEVVEQTEGQGVRITCPLAEPLAALPRVRLDLPTGATVRLGEVTLRARRAGGAEATFTAPADARANQLIRSDRGWLCEGAADAYLVLETEMEADAAPIEELVFEVEMTTHVPTAAADALREWDWEAGRGALIEEYGVERVTQLEEVIRG